MEQRVNRCRHYLEVLKKACYGREFSFGAIDSKPAGYDQWSTVLEETTEPGWEPFENGSHFGGTDVHRCFQTTLGVTGEMEGRQLWLQVATGATDIWNTDNPQFLIFINGEIICGMDMNHHEVCITPSAKEGECYRIGVYGYSNSQTGSDYFRIVCMEKFPDVEKLYYDFKVPFEAAMEKKPEDLERIRILELLNEVMNRLELRRTGSKEFHKSVRLADQWLKENFYERLTGEGEVVVHSIGHTHIDVAWKWPVRQTREKALRSFATVLQLMKEYPAYRFMSSQPVLYQFVKEDCPALFSRIKERIREGRWETEGAMWLEADCNLTSGESLVRQILYGKAFFAEEFDRGDNRVLWLPDVFGYSAAMPQIMKKSGIDYFMTTKIGWNEYNKFPHDMMMWQGIDGTEVLTYFITTTNHRLYPELSIGQGHATTYNGRQNMSQVMGTWQRFSDKSLTNEVLTCYGFGDGGGGVTAQMLEEDLRISRGIPGCPVTRQTFSGEFFKRLENRIKGKKLPKWVGELYLEFHRGTYTSMGKNKRYNRRCEFLNQDVEFFSTWAMLKNSSFSYPKKELDRIWKMTLLNQFHDILPGSSIEEVYKVTTEEYEEILTADERLREQAVKALIPAEHLREEKQSESLILWNTLSFERDALIDLPDGPILVKGIPPKGYRKITLEQAAGNRNRNRNAENTGLNLVHADEEKAGAMPFYYEESEREKRLQTPFYEISFGETGEITSLTDRENGRQLVKKGEVLNRLMAFEDRPCEYDSWNIDAYYEEKEWDINSLLSFEVTEKNEKRFCLYVKRAFMESVIEQKICFYAHSRRIDFKTELDWREEQILVKAAFPVQIHTNKVVCDIQFGNVERPTHRNTSWDEARFEFCAHKWVDVSEAGYGAALLNDCKYGYDVQGSNMRITLLKSGIDPNPNADKETHLFTYSLLPHQGDFRTGGVIKEAFDLNVPVSQSLFHGSLPEVPEMESLFEIKEDYVISETCKLAEDGDGFIIRLYECFGMTGMVHLKINGLKNFEVIECDLSEKAEPEQNWRLDQQTLSFTIKPYEIKSFKIKQNMQ